MAEPSTRNLFAEGLTDAAGFVVGGMIGFGISRYFGLDIATAGFDSLGGILLCGIGAGGGVQLARRWRARRAKAE